MYTQSPSPPSLALPPPSGAPPFSAVTWEPASTEGYTREWKPKNHFELDGGWRSMGGRQAGSALSY
ncbi:uncharacterized protein STEHIDRAFT_123078 [Stereum hirsutum FP-91666 SS1]|uniref:uncharacterized protein n=1 Tax=Stereum hirsutum (strain FP-91666) TaxID=721885 RepID=UPI000444A842|nr:uncharacterized protein STEHIDRAFT_123078 [Stereum hirsutum FP-91666 SS1]EIM84231.1 hypothetical protein STEHIDRAFT_123078 [Stereum hirsutum FP-91666 SS1]